jgi:hypothetical protein
MKLLLLALFVSTLCFGSNVVRSIDLPYGVVSGIATDSDNIWAILRVPAVLFQIDMATGQLLATIPYTVSCSDPVGLVHTGGVFYFAAEGSPTLWAMTENGVQLGYWDLSSADPDIQSISGIGFNCYDYPGTNDFILVIDDVSKKIFQVGPLGQFDQATEWIDVSSAASVGDVNCHSEDLWDAMTCRGTGELAFWTPPDYNGFTMDYSYEGIDNITTIAQDMSMGSSYEFAWVYNESNNTLYLVYHGMPLERGTWGGIKADL